MKSFIENLTEKYADAKSRTIIVFIVALLVVGLLIAVNNMEKSQSLDDAVSNSSITELGRDLESTPGVGDASEEYNRLRYQKNSKDAQAAASKGGSAVPTIVSDQVVEESDSEDLIRKEQDRLAKEREDAYQRLLEQRRQEELSALQQQQSSQQSEALQARQEGFEALMTTQAQDLFTGWGQLPRQQYVAGAELPEAVDNSAAAAAAAAQAAAQAPNILYKAGDIVFAVLDTSINSDEEGPIMARIVQGPLKGSKIIGSFQRAGIHAQKLKLVFNVMNIPTLDRSIGFNAVAIDAESARTAMATNVDNHYLLRYGTLFGSSFLEGISNALQASIENPGFVRNDDGNLDNNAIRITGRDQVVAGFSNIGKKLAEESDFFDRPPTITIDSGSGFGLLMLADLNINAAPADGQGSVTPPLAQIQPQQINANATTNNNVVNQAVGAELQRTGDVFASALRDAVEQGGFNTVAQQ